MLGFIGKAFKSVRSMWKPEITTETHQGFERSLQEKHALLDHLQRQATTCATGDLDALQAAIATCRKTWGL